MSVLDVSVHFPRIIGEDQEQDLDDEWRSLMLSGDVDDFLSQNQSAEGFWVQVHQSGKYMTLSKFTKSLLTIPVSNADCERIFSCVNIKKSDKRNRLSNRSLTNEIISGEAIKGKGECVKFEPSNAMIKAMNKDIYK